MAIALSPLEWSRHVAYIEPESVECYSTLPVPVVGRRARAYYSVPRLSRFSKRNSLRNWRVAFHPSIPLLHILTLTDQTAEVAVVPDSRHLTHPEIVQLVRRVINNFDIVNTDGLVTFVPREQSDSDATHSKYQVWILHQILSWLRKGKDESPRSRALRNMSKVLSM
ncbi:hypothetical protein BDN70DRAFT_996376 [Pholiota conissans]|uniref:Uncharacterized protein n=1 Tax=Pholiota conissans TaxID=109636 RepID=A0A9P6CQX4_9AGAR|nr:hypothetical protein BDN70DRAFT_996376 [Pholiota conissans]